MLQAKQPEFEPEPLPERPQARMPLQLRWIGQNTSNATYNPQAAAFGNSFPGVGH